MTVVGHAENKGHIDTYNEGIAWASAEYFLLLSADDLLVPGALKRAVEVMDANPDVVLTYGKVIQWHDHLPIPDIKPMPTLCLETPRSLEADVRDHGEYFDMDRYRTNQNPKGDWRI